MPAGATYEPIETITLNGSVSTVTLGAGGTIPQTYTDLILVFNGGTVEAGNFQTRFNGNASAIYSTVTLYGAANGTPTSGGYPNINVMYPGVASSAPSTLTSNGILHFSNYSNNTTFKNMLARYNNAAVEVDATISTWRSTDPVTSITIYTYSGTNYLSGSTFTLYGIKAA
jgi:hypothetical protein